MQLEDLTTVSWHREMLPDFLWIALMMGRRSDWQAVYTPLEILDDFVPDGHRIADGRLTSFALVPEDRRVAARNALRRDAPFALPTDFGHLLGLFPSCPASWLFVHSARHRDPDPGIGIPLLRSLLIDNGDKSGVQSTRLRMAAFSRLVTHGKIRHTGDSLMEMVPKYPYGLNAEEQGTVESLMRAMWGSLFGIELQRDPSALKWAREFWQQSRRLSPCVFDVFKSEIPVSDGATDGPLDPEPMLHLAEFRALLSTAHTLGNTLRMSQLGAFSSPHTDAAAAVLFGMASRMYRIVLDLLDRPSSWSQATASLFLRPLAETRIVAAWLAKRNDPTLIASYREHGLGNLKLLRDHIRADLGEVSNGEIGDMLYDLDRRVNLEVDEWAQTVNIGAFTDTTIRKMAIECDLKRLYDLVFVPMSSENHGEWPSVRDNDTAICTEPLHGGHRVGAFVGSPWVIGPEAITSALGIAEEGIVSIFSHFGIDISQEFTPLREAFEAAVFMDEDDTS